MPESHKHKKVWAFLHVTHEDMGSYEFFLKAIGIRPVPMLARDVDIEALDPAEADLVLIMGGHMGVYEADAYPHLHHEIRFAEQRIARGLPTLGICLGSQIIAKALGADVYKGAKGKEVGWHPVTVSEAGMRTPVRHFDAAETMVAQWHGDTFDLPQGATLLASNEKYANQAYSYGNNVLGMQFHPEVTEVKLERWYAAHAEDIAETGTSVAELRASARRHAARIQEQNRQFFLEWLAQVAPQLLEKHPRPSDMPAKVDAA